MLAPARCRIGPCLQASLGPPGHEEHRAPRPFKVRTTETGAALSQFDEQQSGIAALEDWNSKSGCCLTVLFRLQGALVGSQRAINQKSVNKRIALPTPSGEQDDHLLLRSTKLRHGTTSCHALPALRLEALAQGRF